MCERYDNTPCHLQHGLRRRRWKWHGLISRARRLQHILSPQEHRRQKDMARPANALPAVQLIYGQDDTDVFKIDNRFGSGIKQQKAEHR